MKTDKERIAAVETDLANHKEQCVTDKINTNSRLDSINNKLWACLVIVLLQFVGIAGYLATHGTPWIRAAEVAGR